MRTYNDLIATGADERARIDFILGAISEHKNTYEYQLAYDASLYYANENPTIMRYQKIIYDYLGRAKPDVYAANNKIPSNLYFYFVTQGVQYLLANGVTFNDDATKEKLGGRKFDIQLQKLATFAKNSGVAFGFYDVDHIEVFDLLEFVPFYDEENGALRAGIRFWQIDDTKPLRFTVYEEDGYTDYIRRVGKEPEILMEKRPYILNIAVSEADGVRIYDGTNYASFPIVPLYNIGRKSEINGKRNTIDAYDLVTSQLVNNIDEANLIYWVLKNCGGMDMSDDAKFIEQLKTTHVAHVDGDGLGATDAEAHTIDVPVDASKVSMEELKEHLYTDFMALDVRQIQAGNTTATQINAAYEPLNQKTSLFEDCVSEFIYGILSVAGIDDDPSYKYDKISNLKEDTETVMLLADYLGDRGVLSHISWIQPDEIDELLKAKADSDAARYEAVAAQLDRMNAENAGNNTEEIDESGEAE